MASGGWILQMPGGEALSPVSDVMEDSSPNCEAADWPYGPQLTFPVDTQFVQVDPMQVYPPSWYYTNAEYDTHQFNTGMDQYIWQTTSVMPIAVPNMSGQLTKEPARAPKKYHLDASQDVNHNKQPNSATTKTNKFPCEEDGCGKSFSSGKDLRRHTLSVHTVDQQQYTCRCRFKSPRKDNYLRHLKSRTCSYNASEPSFICVCGLASRTRDDIVLHVASCGKRKPGRPAKKKAVGE